MHTEGRESELLIALASERERCREMQKERDEAVANTQQWLSVVEKLRDNLNKTLLERDDLRAATANANKQTADLNALRLKQDAELVALRTEARRLRERDDAAREMLTQLRAALDEDTTFLGAVLRVEMDKWLGVAAPGEK